MEVVIVFEEEVLDSDAARFSIFAAYGQGSRFVINSNFNDVEVRICQNIKGAFRLAQKIQIVIVYKGFKVCLEILLWNFRFFNANLQLFGTTFI